MFYSLKKDIDRYVSFKNHQIKTLRNQLDEEKVNEESILNAKRKLQKIKNQYNILISENHTQLIDTLQKAETKKKSLDEDLSLKRKELGLKTSQKNDLLNMKRQLQQKLLKARQTLENQKDKKNHLNLQRKQVDQSVKKIIQQNQKIRKQNEETGSLLMEAQKQLSDHKSKAQKSQQTVHHLKERMNKVGSQILSMKQKISISKSQNKIQQLKIKNLQVKIQYLTEVKANLLAYKQKIDSQKLYFKERNQLNKHQTVSSQMMNCLVKISNAMNQNKQVEKEACEREIKQKLIQLQLSECTQNELNQQLSKLQQKVSQVQQNTKNIVEQLQNMQIQDSNLISIITGEVLAKKEKKQTRKLFQNKQNLPIEKLSLKKGVWSKFDSLDMTRTSQDQSEITTI